MPTGRNPRRKRSGTPPGRKPDPRKITAQDKQKLFAVPEGKFYQRLNELATHKKLWPDMRERFIKARLKEVDMKLHDRYMILISQRRSIERVLSREAKPESFDLKIPKESSKARELLESVVAEIASILYTL